MLGAAIERKPKIENVNLAGGKLIREAKVNDYKILYTLHYHCNCTWKYRNVLYEKGI